MSDEALDQVLEDGEYMTSPQSHRQKEPRRCFVIQQALEEQEVERRAIRDADARSIFNYGLEEVAEKMIPTLKREKWFLLGLFGLFVLTVPGCSEPLILAAPA